MVYRYQPLNFEWIGKGELRSEDRKSSRHGMEKGISHISGGKSWPTDERQQLRSKQKVMANMTYGAFGFMLLLAAGASVLISLCCAGIAIFTGKQSLRIAMTIAAIIFGLLAGATYWGAWSILAGI